MPMSEEHKQALAKGRRQARVVKRYLEALRSRKRGRPRDPGRMKERIARIDEELAAEEDPLKRVELQQERIDLEEELKAREKAESLDELERDFVGIVKDFSERKGISYTAWREEGVSAKVLREAGVPRTRRS